MNWLKLLRYDIRNGLARWRYLAVPVLFAIPCFYNWIQMRNAGCMGAWMDYLIGCFKGILPVMSMEDFEFPILWFLIMAGCLFLNLDYPLNDLTDAGQQVIVRCRNKNAWFLSKCLWSLLSTALYIALGTLTALAFAVFSGGKVSLCVTCEVLQNALGIFCEAAPTVGQSLLITVCLPYLTLAAFNMLQMTLSLMMKPILSFLVCVCLLVVSLFFSCPYLIGNGAMVIRSSILMDGMLEPMPIALTCIGMMALSIAVGLIRFKRMDHLRWEE